MHVFSNNDKIMVKHLSTMQRTRGRSLGREDPQEKEMATNSVLVPGKSHGRRRLVGYSPWDCKESDTTERLYFSLLTVPGHLEIVVNMVISGVIKSKIIVCCHCHSQTFIIIKEILMEG